MIFARVFLSFRQIFINLRRITCIVVKRCLLLILTLLCGFTVAAAPQTYRVTARILNVREAPGMEAKIVGSLSQGRRVQVQELVPDGWARITWKDRSAYVSAEYLTRVDVKAETSDKFPLYDFPGGHVPAIPRNWLTTAIVLLAFCLCVYVSDSYEERASNWKVGMVLFLLLSACEIYSVLMLGGDCAWFCMPDQVGVWRMIVNFLLFGFVVHTQLLGYMTLLPALTCAALPRTQLDWRVGWWAWPGFIIIALILDAEIKFMLTLLLLYQLGFIFWVIWKFTRGGRPLMGIFAAFFYLGGALVTLMTAAFYLPMLILVVLAMIALQFATALTSNTVHVTVKNR